jgi:hypothetical protein
MANGSTYLDVCIDQVIGAPSIDPTLRFDFRNVGHVPQRLFLFGVIPDENETIDLLDRPTWNTGKLGN